MDTEEDNYPNFGNAFPPNTTSTSPATASASWNPAFRRDSESQTPATTQDAGNEEYDDFFDRYPGATPKKGAPSSSTTLPEEALADSPIRRQSISVLSSVDVRHEDASMEDLSRVPSNHVEVEGPFIHQEMNEEEDDEEPVLQPDDSVEDQRAAMARRTAEDEESIVDSEDSRPVTSRGVEEAVYLAGHYEHQGESTELEEALEPSPNAPLMANEEPLPTPGREPSISFPSRESTLSFDGAAAPRQPESKAQPVKPMMDRSFTTNFSDSPIEAPSQSQAQSIPEQWPSVGDDKTFGELLGNQAQQPTQPEEVQQEIIREFVGDDKTFSELLDNQPHLPSQPKEVQQELLQDAAALETPNVAAPELDMDLLPDDAGSDINDWGALDDDDELLEETPTDFDPSQAFGGDDDGFLEDEVAPLPVPAQQSQQQQQQRRSIPYRPANLQQPLQQTQPGMPSADFFSQSGHGRSAGTPSTGLTDLYNTNQAYSQQQPARPNILQAQGSAQSFADKSKGGYQSPYDLPIDVVKPRRRPQQQQLQTPSSQAPPPLSGGRPHPPPRTSSMSSPQTPMGPPLPMQQQQQQAQQGRPPSQQGVSQYPVKPSSVASLSPPPSRGSGGASGGVKSTPKSGGSGFFEDLPDVGPKPRARPTPGSFASQQGRGAMPTPPPQPQVPAMSPPKVQYGGQTPQAGYGGLRQPEMMPLLPDQGPAQLQQQVPTRAPVTNARYSPSPQQQQQQQQTGSLPVVPPAQPNRFSPAPAPHSTASSQAPPPPAGNRYSPAPTAQPIKSQRNPSLPTPGIQPFAPRTSSPLAAPNIDKPHPPLPSSPPKVNGRQSSESTRYAPPSITTDTRTIEPPQQFGPPLQRPRTQSPDATMKAPPVPRATRPTSAGNNAFMMQQQQILPKTQQRPGLPHRRQFSRDLTFARPNDERAQDPLERWKGHAIFKWSASGTVLHSFPKQIPFYATGQGLPSVKCTPGAITVQDASTFLPMDELAAKFPGPLTARSKGRKKDVLAWMSAKIEDLERQVERVLMDYTLDVDTKKRIEEKLALWRLVRIFVEHDGVLEGKKEIEDEVRKVLLPNLEQMAQVADLQSPGASAGSMMPDPVDKQVLFQLRQALLEGRRERAVWLAEERKLWGHAMLIASTMGPDTWKQIIQAFVRSQVKSVGSDARSMAALYQVFAGNSEECVDELVPPSARAGFQMISKTDGTVTGNPLEGLDQWRETLGLVTGNRTASDGPSLVALGKLLASYGRVEAAHCCYIFARALAKHSGADDADTHFVLLGANHQSSNESLGSDVDTIILTEIYEWASSFTAPSTGVAYIPHLQSYKLLHAHELAAYGFKTKAQAYCDNITTAYTSTTRPSPYYHPTFTQAVADMQAFLSSTPQDGKSGSFFKKPAMNKVSSGAASWFTKFVSGDEDQDSTGSGGPGSESGPFGAVSGGSPDISRTGSGTDLYGAMMGAGGVGMPIQGMQQQQQPQQSFAQSSASTPGRYVPGGSQGGTKYSPASASASASAYGGVGFPAAEPQRPGSSRYAPPPSSNASLGVPRPDTGRRGSDHSLPYAPSRRGSAQTTSSQGSYEPKPILADESSPYSYSPPVHSPLVQAQQQEPDEVDAFDAPNGLPPQPLDIAEGGDGGYEPPTGGYEPPSYLYQPYEPEPDSPEDAPKPKKRTYGDEDDDMAGMENRAASLKKAQADRQADDAFRKAAEADAARDQDKPGQGKKGWFGGWFGGKPQDLSNPSPGPIKAKLGEQNSFYYDNDLKKWVNKKGGQEAAAPVAATPPPPRAPPSRISSTGPMGPPSDPPSRASSGAGLATMARPPTSGSGPAFASPPSGPPSRTGTPASQPSSEQGAWPALVPPPILNGEGRPSSSLSNASSIDDLLAGPRKGGTVKGKKKGGRYVDVMAK